MFNGKVLRDIFNPKSVGGLAFMSKIKIILPLPRMLRGLRVFGTYADYKSA